MLIVSSVFCSQSKKIHLGLIKKEYSRITWKYLLDNTVWYNEHARVPVPCLARKVQMQDYFTFFVSWVTMLAVFGSTTWIRHESPPQWCVLEPSKIQGGCTCACHTIKKIHKEKMWHFPLPLGHQYFPQSNKNHFVCYTITLTPISLGLTTSDTSEKQRATCCSTSCAANTSSFINRLSRAHWWVCKGNDSNLPF